jgi:hypothetical protein
VKVSLKHYALLRCAAATFRVIIHTTIILGLFALCTYGKSFIVLVSTFCARNERKEANLRMCVFKPHVWFMVCFLLAATALLLSF